MLYKQYKSNPVASGVAWEGASPPGLISQYPGV